MLYYRKKNFINNIIANLFKLFLPLCISVCLVAIYSSADGAILFDEYSSNIIPVSCVEYSQPIGPEYQEDFSFENPAVGVLTSNFGSRWGRMHKGIDIGADSGAEIVAAESGTVICAKWVNGYGNYIVIEHQNGYSTAYAHCQGFCVSEGESVKKGQVIGLVGSTGNSTGPHLHFEILLDGEHQNPLDYVMY